MTSPALGIAYFLWLRLRLLFAAAFVLVTVFAVAIRLFPETAPYCQFACMIFFFSALVPLLHSCTFGPADLAARTSGFPAYMFVLPMSNRALVGWPMLFAAVIFGGMWSMVATLVFIPTDIPLPVSWPAAMLVAMCVWMQAVGWSPFPSPFIRVPMLVITVAPLILLPVALGILPPSLRMTPLLVAWSIAWSLVAYLFAVRGISRARSGDEGEWFRTIADRVATTFRRRIAVGHTGPRPPFPSPVSAQFWHEWRRNAIAMPVMLAFIGVPFLAALCQGLIGGRKNSGIAIGTVEVSPALLSLAACIGLPVLLSAVSGGMAKFDIWGKDPMPSFFAIRPMTNGQFIRVKLAAAALGTLATWAIMLGMVLFWAALEASPLNPRESIVRAALTQATPRGVAILCAIFLGFAAIMYRNVLVAMWPGLIGRKWVTFAVATFCMVLFVGAVLGGLWVYHNPGARHYVPFFVRCIIGYLLAEKLVGALAVGYALKRWNIVSTNQLATTYASWFLLAGLLFGLISCFIPPTWMVAAGVVLALPLSRVAIFPLALHWNRHR